MFKFLDNWEKKGKSTTLSEVFVCIGVIVLVIVGIVQIKRIKGMSISDAFKNADESDLDYDEKKI